MEHHPRVAGQHLRQGLRAGLHHRQQLGCRARYASAGTAAIVVVPAATTAATSATTLAALLRTVTAKWKHLPTLHTWIGPKAPAHDNRGAGADLPRAQGCSRAPQMVDDGAASH